MANIRKIARRSFLIGSAAIVGGVAFGVYKINEDAPNPLITAEGESTLTPFILINADGVTIITPRAEMGQGVQTTLAALVAEELDVAWEDINVMHGPPRRLTTTPPCLALPCPSSTMRTPISNTDCANPSAKLANCSPCKSRAAQPR